MDNLIVPTDRIPGLSKLARDYLTNTRSVLQFFNANYQNDGSYAILAEKRTAKRTDHWSELTAILTEQNIQMGCQKKTLDNIQKLSQSFAVVTGQQVGLLSGPLYTIYKILTTIKLSIELAKKLKHSVLPVFYLVSEDHDFKEVQWAGTMENNSFKRIVYQKIPPGRAPVCSIQLDESVHKALEHFASTLPETEFTRDVFSDLKECYYPGNFFHRAFAQWIMKLFRDAGIILCDASDVRLKKLAAPVFEKELNFHVTANAINSTSQKLEKLGYHTQIYAPSARPGLAVLKHGRHSLEKRNDHYINLADGTILKKDDLLKNVEKLSPKVALRPIVQDYLFPTIAYVAGPGEISYWAQLKAVYDDFSIPMPVVYPRHGFTLMEPKIKKILSRYNMDAVEYLIRREDLMGELNRDLIPLHLKDRLLSIKTNLESSFNKLDNDIEKLDPTLSNAVKKTSGNIMNQLGNLESKIIKAIEFREKTRSRQLASLSEHLLPENQLQERMLNIVYFLCKYGRTVIQQIKNKIVPFHIEHQILEL